MILNLKIKKVRIDNMKIYRYQIVAIMKDHSKHVTESEGTLLEILREACYIQETFNDKINIFDLVIYE